SGVKGLRVIINAPSDGLLGALLPFGATVMIGDLLLGWRPGRGIYFEGGAGPRITVPVAVVLGPFAITAVELSFTFDPDVRFAVSVDASIELGPLFLEADGLGIGIGLRASPNGRFGSLDLDAGLVPPKGYAASLAGGPIAGGGM